MASDQGSLAREAGKDLRVGSTVKITGLKGAPQHNGCHGELKAFDEEKGRWGVKLSIDGQILGVKPDNLVFVRPPASAFDDEDEDDKISRLKRKFDRVCKKYKLTGEDTASDIADLLTGAKGVSQIGPSYFMEKYKMEETDAESFLAWIKCAVEWKEQSLDPNAAAAQEFAAGLSGKP